MNLHENIHRIQSLLTENREEMVKNMISKYGLYHTIKLMGGYEPILNILGHKYFTIDDKINFIRDAIKQLTEKYNSTGISTYELNMNAIPYGSPDDELQQIEYFNPDFVTIDVYDGEEYDRHKGSFTERYTDLDDNTLDEIFLFMVDALEYNM